MKLGDYRDSNEYTILDFIRDNLDKSDEWIVENWGTGIGTEYVAKSRKQLYMLSEDAIAEEIRKYVNEMNDEELGEKFGMTERQVHNLRRRKKISRTVLLRRHREPESKEIIEGIRKDVVALEDDELGEKYGISSNQVRKLRSKYGISRKTRTYYHLCIDCANSTDMRKCSWVLGIVVDIDRAKFPDGCKVNKRGVLYECPFYKEG